MAKKNNPRYLILHTSDSTWGDAEEINKWHLERGFSGIGYHYVLLNGRKKSVKVYDLAFDGKIEKGRKDTEIGSHALGYNDKSIGVCLIGKHGEYTKLQLESLESLVLALLRKYKIHVSNLIGHYECESGAKQGKTCPDVKMDAYRNKIERLMRSTGDD